MATVLPFMRQQVPLPRNRDAIQQDLYCGLCTLGSLACELEHRRVTATDVTGIDATIEGVKRCLSELRMVGPNEAA